MKYSLWRAYGVGIAACGAAILIRKVLDEHLATTAPLLIFLLPVLVAGWLGGRAPALFAGLISAVAAKYFFIPPIHTFDFSEINARISLFLFLLESILMAVVCESWHRVRRKLQRERSRLAESNQFHAAIAGLTTDFAFSAHPGPQGEFFLDAVTEGFHRLFGYSTDDLVQDECWLKVIHPADHGRTRADVARLNRGEAVDNTVRSLTRDGQEVWLHYSVRPIFDRHQKVVRFYGGAQDITRTKQLDDALRAWKERYEAAVLASGHVLYDYNQETGEVVFGGNCLGMLGHAAERLSGPIDLFLTLLHPDDRFVFRRELDHAVARQEPFRLTFRLFHAQGHLLYIQGEGHFVDFDARRPAHLVGFLKDVTAQRESELRIQELTRRLQQKVNQLETVLNIVPIPLAYSDDPHCAHAHGNRALAHLLQRPEQSNYSALEPAIRDALEILHDGQPIATEDLPMQYAARTGETVSGMPFEIRRPGSDPVRLLGYAAPLTDDLGRTTGAVGAYLDVTEPYRLQNALREKLEQLAEADRRKDEFLATLAHELRNPLAPLRNVVEVLRLRQDLPAEMAWARQMVARQVDHMARLIDDLLDVGRITQGKLVLRRERLSLDDTIQHAVQALGPLLEEQQHTLALTLPEQPLWVEADPVRLTQIFSNLISNAAKYTPAGGHIAVSVYSEAGQAVFSVRDNGIGIPPDKLAHLFEMFYQVDNRIERGHAGLGIGLTLVERLVHMHDGTVSAASEGVGKGATFTVRLPLLEALPAQTPQTASGSTPGLPASGRRVLVADDNVDAAESLATLLSLAGHQVVVAHDGIEAVEKAVDFVPDLALLDIGMPGLNGYEVCSRLRQLPAGRHMTLLALTGWGQEEDSRRALAAGFDAHFVKPLDYGQLAAYLDLGGLA
ncbi:hybrid sensor histidine kinase/response regulator [Gulbenkiania mobilis]|uniref:histidine kinase n=1 Tax=Gulbenkiania mobilis TaxID=397457 RepID=A0ABY2D3F0_GULMO|nr:PAS domain S-box-containing protein [Gulbenkiania mobilis]